jgi:hypothetical protein
LGLGVVVVGLVALLWSTAAGQAMVAVGMGIYFVGVVITVVGIILVYREAPQPRPNFIQLRWSLIHDAVHARSASAEPRAEGTGPLGDRDPQSPHLEDLRHSAHWWPAVWGVRLMGGGVAVVCAGLVTLVWSTSIGKAILAVGVGIYLVGLVLTLVEVRRAYDEVQTPRPNYARIQQTLVHDALHARS